MKDDCSSPRLFCFSPIVGDCYDLGPGKTVTQYFMKNLVKRSNKEISAYLRDMQIDCCTFNIIQHHPTTDNNDSDKDDLLH